MDHPRSWGAWLAEVGREIARLLVESHDEKSVERALAELRDGFNSGCRFARSEEEFEELLRASAIELELEAKRSVH